MLVSWDEGHDASISIRVLGGDGGGLLESDHRLKGHGRPTCADFDGQTLAVGFVDGAVSGFGKLGFLRWHAGSVSAVKVLSKLDAVISSAADGMVNMWRRVRQPSSIWNLFDFLEPA